MPSPIRCATEPRWPLRVGGDQRTHPLALEGGGGGEDGPKAGAARRAEGMRLGIEVRAEVLRVCALPEYADLPSGQIVADLADWGVRYLCSVSSMYRILREAGLVRYRDRTRAPRPRPRGLCARGPRGVWVWDITWLPSACGGHCRLYMALDIHGRKIVGWAVHKCESAELAAGMVARACAVEGVLPGRLTLYSDNGSAMRGSAMVAMLDALVVASSLSRPASSNDNPHNEVWAWDIILLPTMARGRFFPMFAVMDLFSRKVVAMAVHDTQDAEYAVALFTGAFKEHKIARGPSPCTPTSGRRCGRSLRTPACRASGPTSRTSAPG